MSITAYGFASALDQSPEFFKFKRKHITHTNKAIETFNSELDNDFEIHLMHRFDDGNETEPSLGLQVGIKTTVMGAMDMIITKSNNGTLSMDIDVTEAEFANQFPDYAISFDSIISDSNNNVWPQSMTIVASNGDALIVYLYPPKFELSYPNSNVEVIPLFEDVNQFSTMNLSGVSNAIADLDTLPFVDEFMAITEENPCTRQLITEVLWVNRSNLSESTMVPFGLVCYGNPSDEAKEAAVREYITQNSEISKSNLEIIFPTIFGSFGFTLFPYWDSVAREDTRDIYTPVVRTEDMINTIDDIMTSTTRSHIISNWEMLPTVFQSLTTLIVPDEAEVGSIGKFADNIESYFLAAPSTADFVNLPKDTQEFVKMLMDALSVAESYPNTNAVEGVTIEQLGEQFYAVFFIKGLRWSILTKNSYIASK